MYMYPGLAITPDPEIGRIIQAPRSTASWLQVRSEVANHQHSKVATRWRFQDFSNMSRSTRLLTDMCHMPGVTFSNETTMVTVTIC